MKQIYFSVIPMKAKPSKAEIWNANTEFRKSKPLG